MTQPKQPPCALTIAGSDSSSAAGVQADLKTFFAYGVHGLSAVTAITGQNTRTITAVRVLSQEIVLAQLDALLADFPIAAVKIGMLGSVTNLRAVARWLRIHSLRNIVVDPVLVATSGRRLLPDTAISILRKELLPLARVLTPNVPEAEALLGQRIRSPADMLGAAEALREFGVHAVLIKGGHLDTKRVCDYFVDDRGAIEFAHHKQNYAVRGTGCTLASALAAGLALGLPARGAARRAEHYLQNAFRGARAIGRSSQRILEHNVSSTNR